MDVKAFIELGRPVNAVMVFLVTLAGGYLASAPPFTILLAALSATLISMGSQAINDYVDAPLDKKLRPNRPIPSGRISPKLGLYISLLYFILGIILGFIASILHGIIALIASTLSILYSFYIQRKKFIGNIVVSFLTALSLIYGGMGGEVYKTFIPAFIIFLINWGREILKDMEDIEGDRGIKESMPLLIGEDTKFIVAYLLSLGVILTPLPYIMGIFSLPYLIIILSVDIILLWYVSKLLKGERVHPDMIKALMLIGIIAFISGV